MSVALLDAEPAARPLVGSVAEHDAFTVSLSSAEVDGEVATPLVLVDVDMLELHEAEALIVALQAAVDRARHG